MLKVLQPILTFAWVFQCSCLDTVGIFCQMAKSKDFCYPDIVDIISGQVWKQIWTPDDGKQPKTFGLNFLI